MINKTINKLVMFLGIFLMFGIIMFPNMRDIIGELMDTLLKPLLGGLPLHMIIFVLAAFTGLYASLIQKYTMDWTLMKRVQEKSKSIQKEMRQAQLSNNAAKIKKLEGQYQEMMGDQMEMFKQQFKPMLYISIISIPLFYWVYLLISQNPDATMIFPFWGEQNLNDKVFWQFQYWLFWYFLCSIPVSQMTRKALNVGGM
ncbi:MAG: EMC3/TMCO1 family protein [Candidatus Methanoperedens sp.]|nr:EMC3/TMCO1 family protein [Candidatus Methanoperedens sp.]